MKRITYECDNCRATSGPLLIATGTEEFVKWLPSGWTVYGFMLLCEECAESFTDAGIKALTGRVTEDA